MPKSEGGGGGAAGLGAGGAGAGSGSGSSSVGVRVFAVGRYQVTLEESLAEGTDAGGRLGQAGEGGLGCGGGFSGSSRASLLGLSAHFFSLLPPLLGQRGLLRSSSGFRSEPGFSRRWQL